MSINKNTEYEKLTQEIYQIINDNENIKTINIQHNVKIEGKSGCKHQIDVYWEFEMLGEIHKVAIECKNYSDVVSVGGIRNFFGVLHDIGNIKGIFVTKKGYQSGAIKYADYYGITLKELRFPSDKDWEGRIKDIAIDIHAFTIKIKERKPILDMDWIAKNTNFKKGDEFSLIGMTNDFIIQDPNGTKITDFYELESKLPQNWEEAKNQEYEEIFEDAYLVLPNGSKYKINEISFKYDVIKTSTQVISEGETITKAILKNISDGDIKFFDKSGNIK